MESHAHAEEHVALSNLAHIVVGILLGGVGLLAGLEVLGVVDGGWQYAGPALLLGVGAFVPLFILWAARAHKALVAQVLADPQQQQHFVLSGLLFTGGLAEMLRLAGVQPRLTGAVWPLVLIIVGYLFTAHTQHGTSEAVAGAIHAHRQLGGTLILAGVARGIAVLSGVYTGIVGAGWIVLLLAAAIQFLAYREPEGTYASGEPRGHSRHGA